MRADGKRQLADERSLDVGSLRFTVVGKNRSVLYAARWLQEFGATVTGAGSIEAARVLDPAPVAILIAGDAMADARDAIDDSGPTEIRVWDYEIGKSGPGEFASAVSGVSTVIGAADGPPGILPARIPEKWAGIYAASLALSLKLCRDGGQSPLPRTIDVSAADILRAFAEQNSGNHAGVPYGWRRNGRTAVEHGGVFPQGFFRCRDGHVAVQARSRQDWQAILAALGNPAWSQEEAFQNPFKLSEDDSRVAPLLERELSAQTRIELLERALQTGAPMAPVLTLAEAREANVFRPGFMNEAGRLAAPFVVRRGSQQAASGEGTK